MGARRTALGIVALLCAACEAPPPAPAKEVLAWQRIGTWAGRGPEQTQNFTSDNGAFRVHWEARNENPPGAGYLKVNFRSGDSGSVIMEAVDHRGAGRGTANVSDRVRWYYVTIESENLDWTVTIEEPVTGREEEPRKE